MIQKTYFTPKLLSVEWSKEYQWLYVFIRQESAIPATLNNTPNMNNPMWKLSVICGDNNLSFVICHELFNIYILDHYSQIIL